MFPFLLEFDLTIRKANGISQWASVASYKNQKLNRVIGVNFDQGKRNLVRVSGVFELSEFELT